MAVSCRVVFGVRDRDVGADIVETDCAAEGTDHEEVAAAEVVNEEEEPDEGDNCFYHAEYAGCEEGSVGTGNTDGAEDGWGVLEK